MANKEEHEKLDRIMANMDASHLGASGHLKQKIRCITSLKQRRNVSPMKTQRS